MELCEISFKYEMMQRVKLKVVVAQRDYSNASNPGMVITIEVPPFTLERAIVEAYKSCIGLPYKDIRLNREETIGVNGIINIYSNQLEKWYSAHDSESQLKIYNKIREIFGTSNNGEDTSPPIAIYFLPESELWKKEGGTLLAP